MRLPTLSVRPRSRANAYQAVMQIAVHRIAVGNRIFGFGKNDENIVHQ